MTIPKIPNNESARLANLRSYNLLDTLPEEEYDNITFIASQICNTPISLITLIDDKRQWFKSNVGLDVSETAREIAFCAHGLLNPTESLIVRNTHEDDRFKDNPLVTGAPYIDFYAGVSLVSKEGYALGSLCVIDRKPRDISPAQIKALKGLARQVVKILELRKTIQDLKKTQKKLVQSNENLEEFAHIISHDIKGPLRNIKQLTEMLQDELAEDMNPEVQETVSLVNETADSSIDLISGVLKYSKATHKLQDDEGEIELNDFFSSLIRRVNAPENFTIQVSKNLPIIHASPIALRQILENLISNSIKYNDKEKGFLEIKVRVLKDTYKFTLTDNGKGIPKSKLNAIFSLFYVGDEEQATKKNSHGVGLSIVKKLVHNLGGKIRVNSKEGQGTSFTFSLKKG